MAKYWKVWLILLAICAGLPAPAAAQTVLQSRGSNITNGPVTCNGQDTTAPILFNNPALPAAANTYIVGADIIVQTGIVQHVFVGVDTNSIVGPASGNGLLVTLAQGEVHGVRLFPFNSNFVGEVAGFKLSTVTPQVNVTFSCATGQFQGQIFVYFIQF